MTMPVTITSRGDEFEIVFLMIAAPAATKFKASGAEVLHSCVGLGSVNAVGLSPLLNGFRAGGAFEEVLPLVQRLGPAKHISAQSIVRFSH